MNPDVKGSTDHITEVNAAKHSNVPIVIGIK